MLLLLTLLAAGCASKQESLLPAQVAPPSNTGAAQRGKAANRAAMVLSELLSRSDSRAGELAKYADSARIAELACERSYKSLITSE